MKEITSREKILKNIRNASINKYENPWTSLDMESPVFREFGDSPDIMFAQEFIRLGGRFIYCENEKEISDNLAVMIMENKWKELCCLDPAIQRFLATESIPFSDESENLENCPVGITKCECLIARTGSIVVSSRHASGRKLNILPEVHIVLATISQVVNNLKEALELLKRRYGSALPSHISMIAGPSRTADIEKTLVMGAHGPRELYVLLTEEK